MTPEIFHAGKWCCEIMISGVSSKNFLYSAATVQHRVLLAKICLVALGVMAFWTVDAFKSLLLNKKAKCLLKGFAAVMCFDGALMIYGCAKVLENEQGIFSFLKKTHDLETVIHHTVLKKAYRWFFVGVNQFGIL